MLNKNVNLIKFLNLFSSFPYGIWFCDGVTERRKFYKMLDKNE